MRSLFNALWYSLRYKSLFRLMVLSLVALALGLALDWFRPAQRLVFPRPLPVFKTTLSVS